MCNLIRSKFLALVFLVFLSNTALASYFDLDQGLLFQTQSNLDTTPIGSNWSVADYTEVYTLFYGSEINYGDPAPFRQQTVDAILALGGQGVGGNLSCDPFPASECQLIQSFCDTNPSDPVCSSLQDTGGEYSVPGFAYDGGEGSANYLDLYELFGTYSDIDGDGLWENHLTSNAAPIGYDCEVVDCVNANGLVVYVSEVPLPAGLPLMISALLGLLGLKRLV
jgi:hypothetical protein